METHFLDSDGFISTLERPPKVPVAPWSQPMSSVCGKQSEFFKRMNFNHSIKGEVEAHS